MASSSTATSIQQQQKTAYLAPPVFKRQPIKPSRPKSQTQSYLSRKRIILRGVALQSSSPPLNLPHPPQSSETLSTAHLATARYSSGRKVGPLCGTMGRTDRQQMGPFYRPKWFQDTIQVNSSCFGSSNKSESIFLPVVTRRDCRTSPKTGSGKGTGSGNFRLLFPAISSTKKELKITSSNRSSFT